MKNKHDKRRDKIVESMESGDYTRDYLEDIEKYKDIAEEGDSLEDREKAATIRFKKIKRKLGAI